MPKDPSITDRIAIVGAILAIVFGIVQAIPENKTYSEFGVEMAVKIIGYTVFKVGLVFALLYLVALGLRYISPGTPRFKNLDRFLYDLFIGLFAIIVVWAILLVGGGGLAQILGTSKFLICWVIGSFLFGLVLLFLLWKPWITNPESILQM
ncbi:MAG TPA: hypothetical protein VLJ21_02550 [Candidatus Binatia bacterium]|nr:hypothetical protein [Candidatus Binatia bacterium]